MMSYLRDRDYEWKLKSNHPTDITWNSDIKSANNDCSSCGTSWRCGNAKKRKRLVDQFSKTCSVHGTAYICPNRRTSTLARIFYKILFAVCFLLVIGNVVLLLQEKMTKESTFINSINKDMDAGRGVDPDHFPNYPRVTICRQPPHRTDFNSSNLKLVEYIFMAIGYPYVTLTPEELTLIIQIAKHEITKGMPVPPLDTRALSMQQRLNELERKLQDMKRLDANFNLKSFIEYNSVKCEDFFINCIAMIFPLKCCDIFKPILTSMGLCYTLEKNEQLIELIQNVRLDISLIIDLPSPPKVGRATEEGFHVFLSDPTVAYPSFEKEAGQKVLPGLVTTITTELIKTQRNALHTPWHGLGTDCPKMPVGTIYKGDRERYSHHICTFYMVMAKMRVDCDCEWILYPDLPTMRYCGPTDQYRCFTMNGLKNNLSDIIEKCHPPCISYKYKSEVSYLGLGTENSSRVEILYNSKQYVSLEYRTITLSSLFSQIGGALGLYLGASIITVVEIFTFVVCWIWHKFGPSRTTTKPPRRNSVLHSHTRKSIYWN